MGCDPLIAVPIVWAALTYSSEPLKIHMSPDGNDGNQGLSSATPVKTLDRVQNVLRGLNPTRPIEVHIEPGIYYDLTVIWDYYNEHPITFTAANFSTNRPVFDGRGANDWFEVKDGPYPSGNIHFRYIEVTNYNHAIILRESGNSIYGMYFRRIGAAYSNNPECGGGTYSCGVIRLFDSDSNVIRNNHFVDIVNPLGAGIYIHGVYLAYGSSNNEVLFNRFENISGDPIRIRDYSNFNKINNNEFTFAGDSAYYSDWFSNGECRSYGNELRDNVAHKGYGGADILLFKRWLDNQEGMDCTDLSEEWLYTSGNIFH